MPNTHHYPNQLETRQDVDDAVMWLNGILEDFPEPFCTWLDERSDDCEHGPHCWSAEVTHNQSTPFSFNVSKLGPALGVSLLNACSAVIANDDFEGLDFSSSSDAPIHCDRVYTLTVKFTKNSVRQPLFVTFDVYWALTEED